MCISFRQFMEGFLCLCFLTHQKYDRPLLPDDEQQQEENEQKEQQQKNHH